MHKAEVEQHASRILNWLATRRREFEQLGVAVRSLSLAVGLTDEQASAAIDHLENHEEVVRMPDGSLKPGRGWTDTLERQARQARGA